MTAPLRRADNGQAFWTVVVALPAAASVLRLWVEAGGQVQTALLLVQDLGSINLFASMFLTGTRLLSAAVIGVVTLGTAMAVSSWDAEQRGRPLRRPPLFARLAMSTPNWLLAVNFALALMTWQILYLPLLLPAFILLFQITPTVRDLQPREWYAAVVIVLVGGGWLLWRTLLDAWRLHEFFVLVMFVVPPLLAPLVRGPLPRWLTRLLAGVGQPIALAGLAWGLVPVTTTPILPLTVTTVTVAGQDAELIRGHVIDSDNQMTTILQDAGGVRYVPNSAITGRVLCPAPGDLPVYQLWVRNMHIEDSLLEGWGRRVRPVATTDATCRAVQRTDDSAR